MNYDRKQDEINELKRLNAICFPKQPLNNMKENVIQYFNL